MCFPTTLERLVEAWSLSPFFGCGMVLWRMISFSILWSVWKERNHRIFREGQMVVEDVVH